MRLRAPLFAALLLALPAVALAKGDWKTVSNADGVAVSRKTVTGSEIVAFRGVTTIKASMGKVLGVLMDNKRRLDWVDRLGKSTVLEKVSPFEYVIYQHFELPLIISDRDYVYRGTATRDENGRVTLHMSSCEHPKAPKTIGVRANLIHSKYVLTPKGDDETELSVEIHTDPKGMLPTWLVNVIQKSWPSKTLAGVRRMSKHMGVKEHPLPPVTRKKTPLKATAVSASTKRNK
jgi:hypothetical protein